MQVILLVVTALLLLRFVVLLVCSFRDVCRRRYDPEPLKPTEDLPLVSVLVPAYNEERVICGTVESALRSDYPNLEIIIIDDGSTDDTHAVASLLAAEDNRVFAIAQRPNQGKAAALNAGIQAARGEYLVSIDADTVVASDMVRFLVSPLHRDEADAVASNLKVGNRVSWLLRWQSVEYITSLNIDRRAQATMGTITTIPGAAGSFRRSAVKAVGGYSSETKVEDTDLTLAMLQAGYSVAYEPRARSFTEAPATMAALTHQRTRWAHGYIHCLWKYRYAFFQCNTLGLYGMPDLLFSHLLVYPLVLASLPGLLSVSTWTTWHGFATIVIPMVVLDMSLVALVLWIDGDNLADVRHVPVRRLLWPLFLLFVFCRVCLKSLLQGGVQWNKLVRTGELADSVVAGRVPEVLNQKQKFKEARQAMVKEV